MLSVNQDEKHSVNEMLKHGELIVFQPDVNQIANQKQRTIASNSGVSGNKSHQRVRKGRKSIEGSIDFTGPGVGPFTKIKKGSLSQIKD